MKCVLKKWHACCERCLESLRFVEVGRFRDKSGDFVISWAIFLLLKDICIGLVEGRRTLSYMADAYKLFSTFLLAVFLCFSFKISPCKRNFI